MAFQAAPQNFSIASRPLARKPNDVSAEVLRGKGVARQRNRVAAAIVEFVLAKNGGGARKLHRNFADRHRQNSIPAHPDLSSRVSSRTKKMPIGMRDICASATINRCACATFPALRDSLASGKIPLLHIVLAEAKQ